MSKCKHEDEWFDRSICPEPCGAMHTRCTDCGVVLGSCPNEVIRKQHLKSCGQGVHDYICAHCGESSPFQVRFINATEPARTPAT